MVSVVTVDKCEEMTSRGVYFGAFVIAGRGPYSTFCVAIDRKPLNVEHTSPYSLVGLAFPSNAKHNALSNNLVIVESAYAVAISDGGQIDEINRGVNLIQSLAFEHSADEGLSRRAITARIFTATPIDGPGGLNGRDELDGIDCLSLGVFSEVSVYLLPQRSVIRGIDELCIYGSAHELWTHLMHLVGNNDGLLFQQHGFVVLGLVVGVLQ